MKYIPILFSTPMVQAILEGRKTVTRRVLNMPKDNITDATWGYSCFTPERHISFRAKHANGDYGESFVKCKYVKGDILWVRETVTYNDGSLPTDLGYIYKAELGEPELNYSKELNVKWKPSIFMPKEACRIFLKVTEVKVERLQDISSEDAVKEGIACVSKDGIKYKFGIPDADGYPGSGEIGWKWQDWQNTPTEAFEHLWVKINGKESWEANPWV